MAENKWNQKLRRKMEGYEQTPPDGLWEAVEAALPGRRAAAFPWWALAGVAAAVLAVVLLWPEAPVAPDGAVAIVSPVETEAVPDKPVSLSEADAEDVSPILPEAEAPARPVSVSKTNVADVQTAVSADNDNIVSPAEPVSDSETEADVVPSVAPADTIAIESPDKPDSVSEKDAEGVPSVLPKDVTPAEPVFAVQAAKRNRLAYNASLVAGGLPGVATSTTAGYGLKASPERSGSKMAPLLSRNKPSETETRHSVAMSVGAMFNLSFSEHWGVETGLQLTNLQTQVKSVSGSITTVSDKTISYVGVPLRVVYTPWRFDRFALYASAGPMFEYGFASFGKEETYMGDERTAQEPFRGKESDAVFSLGANLGAQWQVSYAGALFVQPGLSWHITGAGNTETFYTAHPLSFAISAGFRFGF